MQQLDTSDFVCTQPPVALAQDEIHLWFIPKMEHDSLSAAGSATLRMLLALYLDCDPATLRFEHAIHGKPFLSGSSQLEFNLAHTKGALLIGLNRHHALGVDLEYPQRPRPVVALARRYFDPDEAAVLAALPEPMQQLAFLHLWSCKEAVLKALGRGIGFGLNRLAFAFDCNGTPTHLASIVAEAGSIPEWHMLSLSPDPGYCGALAWRGPMLKVRAFRASPFFAT